MKLFKKGQKVVYKNIITHNPQNLPEIPDGTILTIIEPYHSPEYRSYSFWKTEEMKGIATIEDNLFPIAYSSATMEIACKEITIERQDIKPIEKGVEV